jgi:hypothetical protein
MAIGFVLLRSIFKLALHLFQFRNEVGIGLQKDILCIVLGNHVFQFSAALLISFQAQLQFLLQSIHSILPLSVLVCQYTRLLFQFLVLFLQAPVLVL